MKAPLGLTILAATCAVSIAGCGGSGSYSAGEVATMAKVDKCRDSGYDFHNGTDGTEHAIYDCQKGSKKMCVIVVDNIARNETWMVRELWTGILGEDKPACITR